MNPKIKIAIFRENCNLKFWKTNSKICYLWFSFILKTIREMKILPLTYLCELNKTGCGNTLQ